MTYACPVTSILALKVHPQAPPYDREAEGQTPTQNRRLTRET
jgi:hypothetical protein